MNSIRFSDHTAAEADMYFRGLRDWRRDLKPAPEILRETWDRAGLEALVEDAAASYEETTGSRLPYNLAVHGPWVAFSRRGRHTAQRDEMIASAARLSGFLRALPCHPLLRRMFERGLSSRGMNSPHTYFCPYMLSARFSPGAAERRLGAIMDRANEILRPVGVRASWAGLADAVSRGPRSVGKAAIIAAACTMGWVPWHWDPERADGSYRGARNFLGSVLRPQEVTEVTEDGISAHVVPQANPIARHGVTLTPIAYDDGWPRRTIGYFVRFGHRTYHASASRPEWAMRDALAAWREQREAERLAALARPDTGHVCLLVTRSDSLEAGNCGPGTEAYIRTNGWEQRWYVPAGWLLDTANPGAHRAVAVAAQKTCLG